MPKTVESPKTQRSKNPKSLGASKSVNQRTFHELVWANIFKNPGADLRQVDHFEIGLVGFHKWCCLIFW